MAKTYKKLSNPLTDALNNQKSTTVNSSNANKFTSLDTKALQVAQPKGTVDSLYNNASKTNNANTASSGYKTTDSSIGNDTAVPKAFSKSDVNVGNDVSKIATSAINNTNTMAGSADATIKNTGYSAYNAHFTPSQNYYDALNYTNQLLHQLSSVRTDYTSKVNDYLSRIENREAFQYDMDSDTLFQNALASAMNSGQTAMQDTIGQASSLTGGYGSTYVTSAANQAYNGYIQDAYDNLPEFYNMAKSAYDDETQNLYNMLDAYSTQDQMAYDRLANAYSANNAATANMYEQEYNNFWQTQSFNESSRQWAAEMAYKQAQAEQEQANWQLEYLNGLSENSQTPTTTTSSKPTAPTSKQYETALALYNKGGDADTSDYAKYIVSLESQGVDIDELEAYVMGKGNSKEFSVASRGNIFTKKDNTYQDQWGNTYTYEEWKKLTGK